jgi:hypothetical protein
LATAEPESVQTGLPLLHESVPEWHGAEAGAQLDPTAQVTQVPLLQTMPFPQPVPLGTFPVDVQTDVPEAHEVVPVRHALPPGVHGWLGVHELHVPLKQ